MSKRLACFIAPQKDRAELPVEVTGLGSAVGRVSAPRSGGTRFDPELRHTKVINNGTSCSMLGTQCLYNVTNGGIK